MSLIGKRSAEVRQKKWGRTAFVKKMREWGKLGGRPKAGKKGKIMIYKRGKFYWYRFMFNGTVHRSTTKILIGRGVRGEQSPMEKAKQIEAAERTRLALGEAGIRHRKPTPTLSTFSERFVQWMSAERADKANTIQFYEDRIRQLLGFDKLKNAAVDRIDEKLVGEYVQWRTVRTRHYALRKKNGVELADTFEQVSVACINRDLATLRRMLNVARLWKVIPSVPIIRLLPGEQNHERVISHTEEDQYLSAAPLMLRQFATVMIDTGMRPEEVCRTRWENVHLEPVNGSRFGYIHNPHGKTKWAKRNLSLTARVQALLSMRHQAAGKPAVGWVFLYDLRHTFLTRLGEANADPYTIQKNAGHASILISQRYVHPTPERLEDAFAKLEVYNQAKVERMKAKERAQNATIQ